MSRIFNILVTFKRDGNRAAETFGTEPRTKPSNFAGKIVVTDEGRLYGYVEKAHLAKRTSLGDINYLAGVIEDRGSTYAMAFYQMTNDRNLDAHMHILPSLEKPGRWASRHDGPMGKFKHQGKVKVALDEVEFSTEAEKRILDRYNQVSKRIGMNQTLLGSINYCTEALKTIEESLH